MALTGKGLRVPRGPLGFLAGLIDGFQPAVPAIQAQQERRREEAAKKKEGDTPDNPGGSSNSKIAPPHDMSGSKTFPEDEPQVPEGDEDAEVPPRHQMSALPSRGAFQPRYAGGVTGMPTGTGSTMPSSRRGGNASPAASGNFGQLSRAFGRPGGPKPVSPQATGGLAHGAGGGGSDAERYASHLQAAGMPEALVRQLTAERYGV